MEPLIVTNADNSLPKPTLDDLLKMNKKAVDGIDYAVEHNVEAKSDYGAITIALVRLLLQHIHDNMTDSDTIADIIQRKEVL